MLLQVRVVINGNSNIWVEDRQVPAGPRETRDGFNVTDWPREPLPPVCSIRLNTKTLLFYYLRCHRGCVKKDRSRSSLRVGIRWFLRKGSLSGIRKRDTSLHFYLLHLFLQLPFRAFSWRGCMSPSAVCALLLIAAAGSFMASFPTFHARSRVFARSRTVTVLLAVETA